MRVGRGGCFPVPVISLALLFGSVLLVLVMLAVLFGPLAAPARED
jgi:hypothetical protein